MSIVIPYFSVNFNFGLLVTALADKKCIGQKLILEVMFWKYFNLGRKIAYHLLSFRGNILSQLIACKLKF